MRAIEGTKIITDTAFGYCVLEVTGRTANTIATRHLNSLSRDHRANLAGFRVFDLAKCSRILQLEVQIKEMRDEQRELYQSLERLE